MWIALLYDPVFWFAVFLVCFTIGYLFWKENKEKEKSQREKEEKLNERIRKLEENQKQK